ncbi:MAG: helix-hairpin-helix domain-containing protein [Eubacterium sp.]|nr:helix-hairpin-helix domain-containing protein [Eubacterium sp.]
MIILSGVILYFALSIPRISVSNAENTYEYSYSQAVDNSYTYSIESDNITSDSNVINNNSGSSVSYPLNLNTCTVEELMSIDGIGEKKASDIIEYRDYLGGYTSVEQIKNIKGIGDSAYEKFSPYLIV